MTLSLDDVRNKRFRMARKSGYEVLEVDEFVDEVEVAFAQLVEENASLKQQVESLQQAAAGAASAPVATEAVPAPVPIVVTTGKEASTAVVRLVEMSTEQAERLVAEATEDADRIREEASRSAQQVTSDSQIKAERVESEARVNAERLESDAVARAEQVERDLEERRSALFGTLEQQRNELAETVNHLRIFEASFRANLTTHLRGQIESLEAHRFEPDGAPDVPELRPAATAATDGDAPGTPVDPERGPDHDLDDTADGEETSNTPRLDALLGEQR